MTKNIGCSNSLLLLDGKQQQEAAIGQDRIFSRGIFTKQENSKNI
jgi:hypothetical protein